MAEFRNYRLAILAASIFLTASLIATVQNAEAATITTSIGYSEWPTYCGIGQTRSIVVQILPFPSPNVFTGATLNIIAPNGVPTSITRNSDTLGTVTFRYTPTQIGTYQLSFSFPGNGFPLPDYYTPLSSTTHYWIVGSSPDTNPPTGNLSIGQYDPPTTTTQSVTLYLDATDSLSEVWFTRISNDGISWSSWEDAGYARAKHYGATKPWTLSNGPGLKTVYVQYRDENQNPSSSFTDQIILLGNSPLTANISPQTQTTIVNLPATFQASASGGTPTYKYQWFEGTTPLGTDPLLTISKPAPGTYSFFCKVTDLVNSSIDSNTVTLTVLPQLGVSVAPTNSTVTVSQSETFKATASGGIPPYVYEWFEGTTLVGGSSQLVISKSQPGTYFFYIRIRDSLGTIVTSSAVELVIVPPLQAAAAPLNVSAELGKTAIFTATVTGGTPPYNYQWLEASTILSTSPSLSISKSVAGTYSFFCRVTDSKASTATSNTVTLTTTILPSQPQTLLVTTAPLSATAEVNRYSTFTAIASGGTPPYNYQWFEGSNIVGTGPTLSASKSLPGTYIFYCKTTDSTASIQNSNSVNLIVILPQVLPQTLTISVYPITATAKIDQTASFVATASGGTEPYTYKWIEGSATVGTEVALSISKKTVGTYSFYCKVFDAANSTIDSDRVTLSVPATIIATPSVTSSPLPSISTSNTLISAPPSPIIGSSTMSTSTQVAIAAAVAATITGVASAFLYLSPKGRILLNKIPIPLPGKIVTNMQIAEKLEEKILSETLKETKDKPKPRNKKPYLTLKVSLPLMIELEPSPAFVEIKNQGSAAAKDVRIGVDSSSDLSWTMRGKSIGELRPSETQRLAFPYGLSSQAKRGVYALRFEAKSQRSPTLLKKNFMRLSRIGLIGDIRNPAYNLPLECWLKAKQFVWEKVAHAEDFMKLLRYDLIILAAETELSVKILRNLSNFVEEGQSLLVVDKVITPEIRVLANTLGYEEIAYENMNLGAGRLVPSAIDHEIVRRIEFGQGIPLNGMHGNICTMRFATGQNVLAYLAKKNGETLSIPALNINTYEKGRTVHLNFHAETNLIQIDALLRSTIDWLLVGNSTLARNGQPKNV